MSLNIVFILANSAGFIFILANNADPDKMPPYVMFHLGLHCLPKYPFIDIHYPANILKNTFTMEPNTMNPDQTAR